MKKIALEPAPPPPRKTGLPHACFLENFDREDGDLDREAALGAFLVLRLVDRLSGGGSPLPPDAFEYQVRATERHLSDETSDSPERSHLLAILRAVEAAWRKRRPSLIAPSVIAYAHYLEHQELRLEQSLDVLETLLAVGADTLAPSDRISATLITARIHRNRARFPHAEAAYQAAGRLASDAGDRNSMLLSRIGLALVDRNRGDLPEAEASLRAVIGDAQAQGLRDAEARAHHDLGWVLEARGQLHDAIRHTLRACDLHEDERTRMRAMVNVGMMLRALGAYDSARGALGFAAQSPASAIDTRLNAMVELMEVASRVGDRVTFEKNREEVAREAERLSPDDRVDYLLKCGLGLFRFGQFRRGEELVEEAQRLAGDHGLHEAEFRIARIRAGLGECRTELASLERPSEVATADELAEVKRTLRRLTAAKP